MKVLIFIIIVTLLFITHCVDNKYYINNDKGVVVSIKKVKNDSEVTIRMISHPDKKKFNWCRKLCYLSNTCAI